MASLPRLTVLAAIGLCVGCGAHVPPPAAPPPASVPSSLPVLPVAAPSQAAEVALPANPAASVIAQANREFATGQQELTLGHLVAAREAFDRAVDVLLASPGGARSDPAISSELDRLADRISALEGQALHDGDGFTEARSTPAVIDQLLGASE